MSAAGSDKNDGKWGKTQSKEGELSFPQVLLWKHQFISTWTDCHYCLKSDFPKRLGLEVKFLLTEKQNRLDLPVSKAPWMHFKVCKREGLWFCLFEKESFWQTGKLGSLWVRDPNVSNFQTLEFLYFFVLFCCIFVLFLYLLYLLCFDKLYKSGHCVCGLNVSNFQTLSIQFCPEKKKRKMLFVRWNNLFLK